MRIALLTEIPAPFRIPLWNALAARPEVELKVLLLAARDPRRAYELHRSEWRFDAEMLPGRDVRLGGRWLVFSRGARRRLASFGPELVILGGWNQPAFLRAAGYARRQRIPYVSWVESTLHDARPRDLGLEPLKRRLLAGAGGVLVPGSAAAAYVRTLGVDDSRIAVAPNAVDVDRFTRAVEAGRARRSDLRRQLDVDRFCFITVTRLSPEKGNDVLVRAFDGLPAELVVVGDGPERRALTQLAPANVRFVGHVRRDEVPAWYAAADAFALASRSETWGMAVAEAATAGLPIVVSEAVGAGWDLVEPGENGFRVPVGDVRRLRDALTMVATEERFRARAAERSQSLAETATPEAWAAGVTELARRLLT